MKRADAKSLGLVLVLWNTIFCTSGTVYGFATLGISADVFFISGSTMMCAASAILGPVLDVWGSWKTGAAGSLIAGIGYVVLGLFFEDAAQQSANSFWAYIGLAMVTFGGQGPYLASFAFSNLFDKPEIIVAVIVAFFTANGIVYQFLSQATGMSRLALCIVFAVLQFVGACISYLVYPAQPSQPGQLGEIRLLKWLSSLEDRATSEEGRHEDAHEHHAATTSRPPASFKSVLMTLEFCGIALWFCVSLNWMTYWYGTAGSFVQIERFCSMVPVVGNLVPAVLGPVVGFVLSSTGFAAGMALTNVLTMAMFLLLPAGEALAFVALFLFSCQRTFIFSVFCGYLLKQFGTAHYGKLLGAATVISALFQLVNVPLQHWAGFSDTKLTKCGTMDCTGGHCGRVSYVVVCSTLPLFLCVLKAARAEKTTECEEPLVTSLARPASMCSNLAHVESIISVDHS
eukprot:TRINITY_DN25134_c0_g2_i1.p1 TRINITY_DN25134_c0_g2~~TRINITY_DN25134_c0_g2_i1.p1  ORF type:complete len:457 (+),score=60.08 TRINITY_DN25134_c0_g2_i1:200-1570(+)